MCPLWKSLWGCEWHAPLCREVANEQRLYIFLKCNMKAFISQSRADRTGCWGGALIQNDHIFTRSQYHQLTVAWFFICCCIRAGMICGLPRLAKGPSERLADGNSIFSELLIGAGRAERKRRLTLICYGNSRQRKSCHTSWSFSKQQSKSRGQTTLLFTKVDCLSNSHS